MTTGLTPPERRDPGHREAMVETVAAIARNAGLPLREQDLPALAEDLRAHLDELTAIDALDFGDVEPLMRFEARWL